MKFNFYKNEIRSTNSIARVLGFVIAFSFILAPLQNVFAERMTSGNYTLQSDSVDFEGGRSTSGSYALEAAAGEIATGDSSSATKKVHAGFEQTDAVSEDATTTPPTPPTSTGSSGSIPTPVNVINFKATPFTKSIGLSWTYPEGADIVAVRIVKSDKFFPNDISDGEVIFEGSGNSIVDNDVKVGTRYYYALFARNAHGDYSSGVLAQARIPLTNDTTPPVKPGDIFENIPPSPNLDATISALSLLDFDFIQGGRKLESVAGTIPVDGKQNLTIQLAYNKVPEILKTIAITLTDPEDSTKVFTFLLRVNKDKTAYEATIAPLGRSGDYKLDAIILDYKNQGLKRLNGNLHSLILADAQGILGNGNTSMLTLMIVLLVLAFIAVIAFIILERRKKQREALAKKVLWGILLFLVTVTNTVIYIPTLTATAHAAINKEINYQGKLANSSDDIVADGTYAMEFNLYTVSSGGSPIWTESLTGGNEVQVTNGLFSVLLGQVSSLAAVDFNQTLYLGVNIEGDGEMTPRKKIGAVPAAFVADTLDGLDSTQFLRSDATNASGIFTAATITNATITNASTTDITVAGKFYDSTGAAGSNGQVLKISGGLPVWGTDLSGSGGGSEINWTYFNGSGTYVSTTTNQVLIGDVATTSNQKLEVIGGTYISGNLGLGTTSPYAKLSVNGKGVFNQDVRANYYTATSTSVASTFPYASSTAITVSGTASTSNLIVSNNANLATASIGTLNGLLYGTNGAVGTVATSTLNIALSDTTGTLAVNRGGTGLTSYTLGDVLYANGTGSLAGTSTANLKTTLGLNNVENTALSTWAGSTNLTTLGTILTGVWNGTAIGDAFITKTGNWTGTFDGQEGSYYLDANNLTNFSTLVNAYIHASSTIPKTYTNNTYTGLQTFGNNISLGGVQLNVSALAYGNLLSYNGINWVNTATSSLNIALSDTTGTLPVSKGGTGQTSFGQGWLHSDGTTLTSSTSPTVSYITATSTTATSTFAGNIAVGGRVGIGSISSLYQHEAEALVTSPYLRTDNILVVGTTTIGGNSRLVIGNSSGVNPRYWDFNSNTGVTYNDDDGHIAFSISADGSLTTGVSVTGSISSRFSTNATGIGFFNTSPIAKPSSTTDLRQALINLGLYTTGGATPLNLNGGALTAGTATIGTLNGPLQANNGVVSATTSIGVLYGGTGLTSIASSSILVGNAQGGYTPYATSSLGLTNTSIAQTYGTAQTGAITFATSSQTTNGQTIGLNITNSSGAFTFNPTLSGTLAVAGGGTGATTFGQGWIYSDGGTGALNSSTSPTINYLTATSTTQASTFPYASTTMVSATTASTTNLIISGVPNCSSSSALTTNSAGVVACGAILGSGGGSYPFSLAGNATSTLTQFNGGLTSYASTTIGAGGQATGLTIFGGATTTGNAYFAGKIGIGTTTPYATLSVVGGSGDVTAFAVYGTNGADTGGGVLFQGGTGDSKGGSIEAYAGNKNSIDANGGDIKLRAGFGGANGVSGKVYIDGGSMNAFGGSTSGGDILLSTVNTGNVGIGTTSPYAKLSVNGQVVGAYFTATTSTASTFRYASTTMVSASTASTTNLIVSSLGGTTQCLQANSAGVITGTGSSCSGASASYDWVQQSNIYSVNSLTPSTTIPLWIKSTATSTFAGGIESWDKIGAPYFVATSTSIASTFRYASTTALTVSGVNGLTLGTLNGVLYGTNGAVGTVATSTLNIALSDTTGILAISRGGTGTSTAPTYGKVLLGNALGTYDLVATSSLGLGSGFGSVTSIDASGGTTGLSFTGGPVTTSGTLTLAGILGVANGGTGWANINSGYIPFGNGASALATSSSFFWDNTNARLGIGTSSPYAKLSVAGDVVAANFIATSTTATSTFAGSVNIGNGALSYDSSTGTTSISYLEAGNMSFAADSGVISWIDMPVTSASANGVVNSYSAGFNGSPFLTIYGVSNGSGSVLNQAVGIGTTSPNWKLSVAGIGSFDDYVRSGRFVATSSVASVFPYASTTALTVSGTNGLTLGTLNGPLQANAGIVSATSSIGVLYGGTGLTSAPSYGNILVGNSSGGYTLTATSSLGLATFGYLFPSNATSTLLSFTGGLTSYASTTIGAGGQTTGLTINGGATTTGNAYFAGNVGVGTTSPYAKLSVSTTAQANGTLPLFTVASTTNASLFTVLGNGNVGIATTTPFARFSIGPVANFTNIPYAVAVMGTYNSTVGEGILFQAGRGGTKGGSVTLAAGLSDSAADGGDINLYSGQSGTSAQSGSINIIAADSAIPAIFGGTAGSVNILAGNNLGGTSGAAGNVNIGVGTGGFILLATSTGNVGIGTTSPYAKLSVNGQVVGAYFTATTSTASTFPYASTTALTVSGANGLSLGTLNGPLQANNGVVSATTSIGVLYGGTGLTSAPSYGNILVGNSSGGYTLTATSSLGLATFGYLFPSNATSTLLSFNGGLTSYASTTIGAGGQTTGLTINGGATTTGNAYFAGNVGVGTTSPAAKLAVSSIGVNRLLYLSGITSNISSDVTIFESSGSYEFNSPGFSLYGVRSSPVTTSSAFSNATNNYAFYGNPSGGLTDWGIYLTGEDKNYFSGKVGIATTSPWRALSVSGSSDLGNNALAGYFTATTSTASTFPYASTTMLSATTASTTNLIISGLPSCSSTSALTTNASGVVACGALSTGAAFAWTPTTFGSTAANATSTLIGFNAGLYALASSTIGGGTQATGLTINGGATTTGNLIVQGTGTSTFAGGITGPGSFTVQSTSGWLGLGTSNPGAQLGIAGDIMFTNSAARVISIASTSGPTAGRSLTLRGGGASSLGGDVRVTGGNSAATGGSVYIYGALADVTNGNTYLGFDGTNSVASVGVGGPISSASNILSVTGQSYFSGNVGIGTTSPFYKLSVEGTSSLGNNALAGYFTATTSTASTFPYASTTMVSATTASTTNLIISGLPSCSSTSALTTNSSGVVACGAISGSGGAAFAWTPTTNYAVAVNSTTTPIWFQNGLMASTTAYLAYASTTMLSATTASTTNLIVSSLGGTTQCLQANSAGVVSGTGSACGAGGGGAAFAWTPGTNYGVAVNSTTTPIWFQNGLMASTTSYLAYASTTALTVFGNAYFPGSGIWNSSGFVGIGTTSPYAALSVVGASGVVADKYYATSTTATSTFAGGLDVGQGNLVYDFATGVTSISSLESGNFSFDTDAGVVSWTDLPISSAPANTPQGYTAYLGGNAAIKVYGTSNGSGGLNMFNVGIGSSTAPSSKLSVFGAGTGTGQLFELVNSASTTVARVLDNGTSYFLGNVGVGTTSPYAPLSVLGQVVGSYFTATTSTASTFPYASTTMLSATTASTTNLIVSSLGGTTQCLQASATGVISGTGSACGAGGGSAFSWTPTTFGSSAANATSTLIGFNAGLYSLASSTIGAGTQTTGLTISGGATTTGIAYFASNVGIGTTTPYKALSVVGDGYFGGIAGGNIYMESGSGRNVNFGVGASNGVLTITSGSDNNAVTPGVIINTRGFGGTTLTTRNLFGIQSNGVDKISVSAAGNLGIGTTSPYAPLSVYGEAVASYFTATTSTASTFPYASTTMVSATTASTTNLVISGINGTTQCLQANSAGVVSGTGSACGAGGGGAAFAWTPGTNYGVAVNSTTTPIWFQNGLMASSTAYLTYASTTAITVTGNAYFPGNGIWNSSGFLGIGTTSPYAALSVVGASGVVADKYYATSTTATSTFAGGLDVGAGNLMYDLSTGITSASAFQTGNFNFDTDAGLVSWADLPLSGASSGTIEGYTASLNGSSTISIYGVSAGSGWLQPDYPRVAIGTTTAPSSKLHVFSNGTGTGGTFELTNNASTSLVKVLDNGSFGIGTTSPFATLAVNPVAGVASNQFVVGSSTATNFIIKNNGAVGIGSTTPWRTLDVNGTVALNNLTSSATGNALCITATKEVTDAGGGTCTPSSARFKENITPMNAGFAVDTLSKLAVVDFDYKEKQEFETNHSYGMIAEDVEKIDKNLVDYGYDGKPLSLHFEKITGLLVQAVQEQQVQIKGLASTTSGLSTAADSATSNIDLLTSNVNSTFASIASNLASTSQTTKTLASALDSTNATVSGLNDSISGLTNSITSTNASTSALTLRISSLEGQMSTLASSTDVLVRALASSTADLIASSTAQTLASSTSFIASVFESIKELLATTVTKIKGVFVGELHVEEKLCVEDVCINKDQLKALLINAGGTSSTTPSINVPAQNNQNTQPTPPTPAPDVIITPESAPASSTPQVVTPPPSEPSTPPASPEVAPTPVPESAPVVAPAPAPEPASAPASVAESAPAPAPAPAE